MLPLIFRLTADTPRPRLVATHTQDGRTWLPLGQDRPNQNPLTGNLAGGGDSQTSIGPDHRVCISELNTLISLGVAFVTFAWVELPFLKLREQWLAHTSIARSGAPMPIPMKVEPATVSQSTSV